MSPSNDSMSPRGLWAALGACLLDFEAFPGRFPLALREPRLLFDHGTELLMLASGRAVEGLPKDDVLEAQLRRAARFFVRTAMLRPGTDHYTLMGLTPAFEPARLREHYRMLMRLTHPDFAGGERAWPVDSATRINHANDVLSSAVSRRNYERTVDGISQRWRPVPPHPGTVVARPLLPSAMGTRPRPWSLAGRRAVSGGIGLAVLVLGFWLFRGSDDVPESMNDMGAAAVSPGMEVLPRSGRVSGDENRGEMAERAMTPALQGAEARPQGEAGATTEARQPSPSLSGLLASDTRPTPRQPEEPRQRVRAEWAPDVPRYRGLPTAPPGAPPSMLASSSMPTPIAATPIAVTPITVTPITVTPIAASPVKPGPAETQAAQVVTPAQPDRVAVGLPAVEPAPSALPLTSRLTLDDVQPLLGNVLAAMQTGKGEQVLRWVERPIRQGDGADGFVQAYNRAVANARSVRVGSVRFHGRPGGEGLLVDGVVLLHVMDENQHSATQEMVLRAQFATRGGKAVMTRLNVSEMAR